MCVYVLIATHLYAIVARTRDSNVGGSGCGCVNIVYVCPIRGQLAKLSKGTERLRVRYNNVLLHD